MRGAIARTLILYAIFASIPFNLFAEPGPVTEREALARRPRENGVDLLVSDACLASELLAVVCRCGGCCRCCHRLLRRPKPVLPGFYATEAKAA